jgi:transcriptional regulator with XRE-family HTH domain
MFTEFGKFVRKLRIDRGLMLGDMADGLQTSSAYLSAVETGKKKISDDLVDKVIAFFGLDNDQAISLRQAVDNSPVAVKIDLKNASSEERMLVNAFARKVGDLSSHEQETIWKALGGK